MTLRGLIETAGDKQKICLTIDGNRKSGFWYEDHMLDLLDAYANRPVDVTRDEETLLVARVRRY